ncbi:zinc finger protein 691-like [Euwallacea similis]|uniref:zinc finger protein 691-like n=1 Tax=Euwallacea similis TaxID=1736056 RepID=UPI00345059A6
MENISENETNIELKKERDCLEGDADNISELIELEEPKLECPNENHFVQNTEGAEKDTAALCETLIEESASSSENDKGAQSDSAAVDSSSSLSDSIVAGIPNDILVFCCQPESSDPMDMFPCKECGMVAGCIFCLKSHYESLHLNLGIIQYKCNQMTYLKSYTEICNKCSLVCECTEEMIEHRKVHFVTCDVCDMTFDNALFLSNHCKSTHEKFEVIISCDLCEQWFKRLQELSDHYELYHEMILCIVCFRRFADRAQLTQHHSTHKIILTDYSNVMPYACSKCDQEFAEISELSGHLMHDHPKLKAGYGSIVSKVRSKSASSMRKRQRGVELRFDDCGGMSCEDCSLSESKKTKASNG